MKVKKRNGVVVDYDEQKIENAVMKCFMADDNPENDRIPFYR